VGWAAQEARFQCSLTPANSKTVDFPVETRLQRLFPRCEVPDEASMRYGKLLTRLTHPAKTPKNAHNTGFLRLARPGSGRRGLPFGGENVGTAGSESPFVSSGQALG
jgi:hypothetical protein